jgi:hypothetical protein
MQGVNKMAKIKKEAKNEVLLYPNTISCGGREYILIDSDSFIGGTLDDTIDNLKKLKREYGGDCYVDYSPENIDIVLIQEKQND